MLGLECLTNDFKKVSPAKTPRAQRKIILYFPELGVLCVFAGVIFFQLLHSTSKPNFKFLWLVFSIQNAGGFYERHPGTD